MYEIGNMTTDVEKYIQCIKKSLNNCKLKCLQKVYDDEKNDLKVFFEKKEKMFSTEMVTYITQAQQMINDDTISFRDCSFMHHNYKISLLENDHLDYVRLRDSIKLKPEVSTNPYFNMEDKNADVKVYRVLPNVDTEPEASDSPQILLLQGVKGRNVMEIFKSGLKPVNSGCKGPGIYLTNSFESAVCKDDNTCYTNGFDGIKKTAYLLVHQVKFPVQPMDKKLKTVVCSKNIDNLINSTFKVPYNSTSVGSVNEQIRVALNSEKCKRYLNNGPFLEVYDESQKCPANFEHSAQDSLDSLKNKILKGSFHVKQDEMMFVRVHHDLVAPAYLIVIRLKESLKSLGKDILYNCLKVKKFVKDEENLPYEENISLDDLLTQLNEEVTMNQQAYAEFLNKECYVYSRVTTVKEDLCFDMSCLFKTRLRKNKKLIYKTDRLKPQNEDYDFILSAITDKREKSVTNKLSTILHLFQIHPIDSNERVRMCNSYLYVERIRRPNKVLDMLTYGYKQKLNGCLDTDFEKAISGDPNYCEEKNKVKKLFFICVASKCDGTSMRNTFEKDSRGCSIAGGSFTNGSKNYSSTSGMIPAYLVVIEVK